ncbi:hypothetical protein A2473_00690 [candidate division WWE3 bacterium RIFOXYC2_FULL_42_13]|uniref:DUF4870 domain-containing protein n=1 Tax=candidate division WWE3 bacterium TaxID=2053526 RepID=A0A3D0ZS63_UNCKA|nr:MAG: hypothetical protein A2245_01095 [candidate division WWE3 bacterium RIFOXYA2_FULL_43_12]OGC66702.1 MAG: hypothetical protein A2274_02070 [candidate division WWE3 bacterium RIFOXYA12_FULL_43_11]OGC72760.1 MAG: hypothetical protein A2473_00690 [candidate division WWE3 bacterium RIFOXYC2_FULL_42_13]OGC72914.1 MAG: hypothetical protein A2337_03920 [candidate division WWE3 bacterium RIFOXYB2_FULL_43_9]OGC75080.1 MAG: hypothetical protein A2547_01275 [candidate division WWE3 bacterium RIFOXYD
MDESQVVEPTNNGIQPENNAAPTNNPVDNSADNSKIMAIVAYFIFFLPLLTEYKDNDFVKYHVKQAIMILLVGVGIGVISSIPIIGWIVGMLAWMALVVLWVMGILNAASEKKQPLPLIGKYAEELLKF